MDDTYTLTTDLEASLRWIGEYCRRNPHLPVAEAVEALVWTLYPQRTQYAPSVSLPTSPPPPLPQWEQPRPKAPQNQSIPVPRRKRS
jgi:hypothetical protein